MKIQPNYYEESRRILEDPSPDVARIARTVQHRLVSSTESPEHGFNFVYFLQAAIRLWLMRHPAVSLESSRIFYSCRPIRGTNWPESASSNERNDSILNRFFEMVRCDSIPAGRDFDVSYAAKMLALSFDEEGELLNPVCPAELAEAEDDYWLSGFNAPQTVH